MQKKTRVFVVSALAIGIIGTAHAQFNRPEDAIEYRQAVMVLIAISISAASPQ